MTSLLNTEQLAAQLGLTESCLAKWRLTGEGPRFVRLGRRVAYRPADVDTWLDARAVRSTSEAA